MITPPAAAYLLTHDLRRMLGLSCAIGVICAVGGFFLALRMDISPTGPMAAVSGGVFLVRVGICASSRAFRATPEAPPATRLTVSAAIPELYRTRQQLGGDSAAALHLWPEA